MSESDYPLGAKQQQINGGTAAPHQKERLASAFAELGFSQAIDLAKEQVKALYQNDQVPWVVGYSGGKDSSATLQLLWLALAELDQDSLSKPVYVITTDTLVENPIVAGWVHRSLQKINEAAKSSGLPFHAHRLTPPIEDSFWVNLIGRGYPAPRHKFRWCTERLKIKPNNRFIREKIKENGEAIVVLGTRKAESAVRHRAMEKHAKSIAEERLSRHSTMPNSMIYTPIEDWTDDDVWLFLMREQNPWGVDNKELLGMYRGATTDGDCPLVVDTSTPSCGNSRFGCWVCTLVEEDKSMGAMIKNDEEKQWMQPLLDLRNDLDFRGEDARQKDRQNRDFRRQSGQLAFYTDAGGQPQLVPGPYTQDAREKWLRKLLSVQRQVQQSAPAELGEIELISLDELNEIRRIWIVDKHEIEDRLPIIYEEVIGVPYPGPPIDENVVFDRDTLELLREVCGKDHSLHYEMVRNLIDQERRFRSMAKRQGIYDALEKNIQKCFYGDKEDALDFEIRKNNEAKGISKSQVSEPKSAYAAAEGDECGSSEMVVDHQPKDQSS